MWLLLTMIESKEKNTIIYIAGGGGGGLNAVGGGNVSLRSLVILACRGQYPSPRWCKFLQLFTLQFRATGVLVTREISRELFLIVFDTFLVAVLLLLLVLELLIWSLDAVNKLNCDRISFNSVASVDL